MKGDFTRDTFDASKHFSRVLMQQGRVQIDADWNEQAAILLHYLQTLAADLIGPHGGPANTAGTAAGDGFKIDVVRDERNIPIKNDFAILKGRYYVNGILCENDSDTMRYTTQAHYELADEAKLKSGNYLVYLDVWERHLTYLEVEDADGSVISIREVALNGPDTATRAQVVWQVKTINKMPDGRTDISTTKPEVEKAWPDWVSQWQPANRGQLKARAIQASTTPDDPCNIPPDARYRGAENLLYRVEVHTGGTAQNGATFKWSRENGSVIFPIRKVADKNITLESLGRDTRLGLQVGDWVEIVDDDYTLQNRAEPLLLVEAIDYETNVVTLNNAPILGVGQDNKKHPLLRRWDQRETDRVAVSEAGLAISESSNDWIELEYGIQIQFQAATKTEPNQYRSGDYWLIPARTATGDVEWPGPVNAPLALGPRGIMHGYAPLWLISILGDEGITVDADNDLRRSIKPSLLP